MNDKWVLIFLCIFALLFGILNVTNIRIEWSQTIMGFSALLLGIVTAYRIFRG